MNSSVADNEKFARCTTESDLFNQLVMQKTKKKRGVIRLVKFYYPLFIIINGFIIYEQVKPWFAHYKFSIFNIPFLS